MRLEDVAFNVTLIAYAAAAMVYLACFLTERKQVRLVARTAAWTGLIANTVTIAARTVQAGRLPLSNLYEYGLLLAWGIMLGLLILELRQQTRGLDVIVSVLGFSVVCLISMQSKEISPLMPALRSNWLTYHVIVAIIAYSAFAISFGGAVLHLIKVSQTPALEGLRHRMPAAKLLDGITYKAIMVGLPFQTLTLVTGAVWAYYAWGSYWSWDPKETWSLITWLVYSAYLHARYVWGWTGKSSSSLDCHEPHQDTAGVIEHEGFEIVAQPTPNNCADCHPTAVKEFEASNHAARSWYAVAGAEDFTEAQLAEHSLLDENGEPVNNGQPNVVALVEGEEATTLGCRKCHEVGEPNADGSIGNCAKCHLGHEYSLETVRKPESCSQCHMGPDHPQREIFEESPHGVLYMQEGHEWNWDASPGTMTVKDTPAPTCATCHMTGFGGTSGTHNVSRRLKWNLTPPQSTKREDWQSKRTSMETVCSNCHNPQFYEEHFENADNTIELADEMIVEGKKLLDQAREEGLLTVEPLDESMEFKWFEMWHHEGRRARFGAVMAGPDYVQWHGIYELEKDLVELEEMAEDLRDKDSSTQGGESNDD